MKLKRIKRAPDAKLTRIKRASGAAVDYRHRFLEVLASGKSPTHAAEQAGVGRSTVYVWRGEDPEFAKAWDSAVAAGLDRIEDEAHRRAVEGVDRPVFQGGQQVGEIREYSDTLLALILRGRRPEVYAPKPESAPRVAVNINTTLDDARKRVENLGLPMLQIETDYETVEDEKKD